MKIAVSMDGGEFVSIPFRGQPKSFLRALSIFLLLVKYVGKESVDEQGQLTFTVPGERKTWINTIADGLAQNHTLLDFFGEKLAATGFITKAKDTFKHAGVKNKSPAWVKFNTHQLWPERISIYAATTAAPDGELVESNTRILELARALERQHTKSWTRVVGEVVESFSISRKIANETSERQTILTPPVSHVALVQPDEVWRRIRERMTAPTLLEEWYIVSDSLQEFLDHWKFFENGFRQHKIKLKWMYFSPEALSESLSMRLQWNRHGHPSGLRARLKKQNESMFKRVGGA